jgi:hypothetical protein
VIKLAAVALLGACAFHHGAGSSDAVPGGDGDAPISPHGCFGPANFSICLPDPLPAGTRDVTGDLDTDGAACNAVTPQIGGPDLCVVDGAHVTVNAALIAHGSRPLVLLATEDLSIAGRVSVATPHTGMPGAGANATDCAASGPGVTSSGAGSGGAGGSFGSVGGHGGTSNNANGTGGIAGAPIAGAPTTVRGGCPGGDGGDGGAGTSGGHGDGGGAVYLLSGGTLSIVGSVNASGAGATHGAAGRGGGGGGGSGGMIAAYAKTSLSIGSAAVLVANGGGGAGGSANSAVGSDGAEPDPTMPLVPAPFGPGGGSNGGPGGAGAASTIAAQPGVTDPSRSDGGGGGGGGGGVILLLSPAVNTGTLSPPPL